MLTVSLQSCPSAALRGGVWGEKASKKPSPLPLTLSARRQVALLLETHPPVGDSSLGRTCEARGAPPPQKASRRSSAAISDAWECGRASASEASPRAESWPGVSSTFASPAWWSTDSRLPRKACRHPCPEVPRALAGAPPPRGPALSRRAPPRPYDRSGAKPVGDPDFRWPPKAPQAPVPGEPLDEAQLEEVRGKMHFNIWQAVITHDWGLWERRIWDMRERRIPYDEVTYTLLIHGYVLSHRHLDENARFVLEEMRQAETHPALLRLNERMVDSAFELKQLGMRGTARNWQNVLRLCWHCAVRFQKKRQRRMQSELEALEPDEVLALDREDARRWLRGHDRVALPANAGPARFLAPSSPPRLALPAPRGRKSKRSSARAGEAAGR
ncbi:unnamed protein product [Prorocentrum cordatum]|uniref:Uncharacterized protein n=1 Tax=Prorocentrum cordatum TaxID=2364126 RepID=A0ABN9PLE6_9DINO|nr:unnamed protein product [Polarella glacialis]